MEESLTIQHSITRNIEHRILSEAINSIHAELCLNKVTARENRSKECISAASVARNLLDDAPCTCPNPDGSYPCSGDQECYRVRVRKEFFGWKENPFTSQINPMSPFAITSIIVSCACARVEDRKVGKIGAGTNTELQIAKTIEQIAKFSQDQFFNKVLEVEKALLSRKIIYWLFFLSIMQ